MSTVIKASGPSRAIDGMSFNFDDIGDRAHQYLEQVRRQGADLLAKAQQDAVAIRQQAEEQGRAAALEAAKRILDEKVSQQLTTLVPALREAIERIHAAKANWLLHWEKTAVHVAAAIAGRVIRRELQRTPEITLTLVKEALELASGSEDIQLRMHPDDLAALGEHVQHLVDELSRLAKPQIVGDPQIAKGGCRIDTRFGFIDQQWIAQLDRIEQELT
jgi:flagellar assembly protein FliH